MVKIKRKLILITGIPGTGKTYIGNYLEKKHGYTHYDLEQSDVLIELLFNPDLFIEKIFKNNGDIVITWGFVPNHQQMSRIESSRAIDRISPKIVNTFDEHSKFKEPEVISEEIMNS